MPTKLPCFIYCMNIRKSQGDTVRSTLIEDGSSSIYCMNIRKSQGDTVRSTLIEDGSSSSTIVNNEGEASLASSMSNYEKLPDHLKSCLAYCCFYTMCICSMIERGKLVRLLLAEGLIAEKPGEIMEDVAEMIIAELIDLGMLQKIYYYNDTTLQVNDPYYKLCLQEMEEQDFFSQAANSSVLAVIIDDEKNIPPDFHSLAILSLFLKSHDFSFYSAEGFSRAYLEPVFRLQNLLILELHGKIMELPDEVGDLVHLRYLGLVSSELDKLPRTLGSLQKLQTLDISWCRHLYELPIEVLKIQQLRHLLMHNSIGDCETRVPKGIGMLVNLQTCYGVYAGGGIAEELSTLVQLRKLGFKRVSEDHATELAAAIMKMTNLVSLSLEAESTYVGYTWLQLFPEFEPFSPPHLLQELKLSGGLVEMPNWLASMENLVSLELYESDLLENQTSVLQFLPKLKHLALWHTCKAKHIGKEFCEAGAFAKLETLTIASDYLVEWSEIVYGAFPSLRTLSFRNCMELRFLPEGLQNISTLKQLCLLPSYNDMARRLNGEENYKIKHITEVLIYECP